MDAIFSKSLKGGGRTYFFDVKEARNKAKYLTISESRPSNDGDKKFSRSTIMVFSDVLAPFHDALVEAVDFLRK